MTERVRTMKLLEGAGFTLILASVIFVPLYLGMKNYNYYLLPKFYLLSALVFGVCLLWGAGALVSKKIKIYKTIMDKPVLILLSAAFLSSLFSIARTGSFVGRLDYFVLSFMLLAVLAIFFWQLVQYITSAFRWQIVLSTLLFVGAASATVFDLKTIFNIDGLGKFYPGIWNTIDAANINFGIWLVIIFLLSSGQLVKKDIPVGSALVNLFTVVVSFLGLLSLGMPAVWWLILEGLVLLIVTGLGFVKNARLGWLATLFVLAVASAVFILFGSPKILQAAFPLEVSLGNSPSSVVTYKTVFSGAKEFVFGTGAGTFNYDFSRFRDVSFNYDRSASGLRFNYPLSTAYAVLAEQGALFSLVFIFVVVYLLAHALRNWRTARAATILQSGSSNEDGLLQESTVNFSQGMSSFLIVVPWVVLTTGMFLVFYSITLWFLWWLMFSLAVIGFGLFNPGTIKEKVIVFDETPEKSATYSFGIIASAGVMIILFIVNSFWNVSDKLFAKSLSADFVTAESSLKKSSSYLNAELSHVALAQVYLNEAVRLSKDAKPDLKAISETMAKAVEEAEIATKMAPKSVGLWENLATMYENAAVLVPDARERAISTLLKARELEPTNALLAWRLGSNYEQAKKWQEAIENYQDAIDLNKNFTEAYTSLANVYELNKQSDKAIDTFSSVLQAAPTDIAGQYNYGRLLYNRNQKGDREAAEKLWLSILEKQPNYSNALFSLGVYYELKKDYPKALEYFYKVKELNPLKEDKSNADAVKAINDKISKLVKK